MSEFNTHYDAVMLPFLQSKVHALTAELAAARQEQEDWSPYLKEGETPLQRLQREIGDSAAVLELLRREKVKTEHLERELAAAKESKDCAWKTAKASDKAYAEEHDKRVALESQQGEPVYILGDDMNGWFCVSQHEYEKNVVKGQKILFTYQPDAAIAKGEK